jgi:ligand-binding sensor domain-containing protein/signal transduction histidine kinase
MNKFYILIFITLFSCVDKHQEKNKTDNSYKKLSKGHLVNNDSILPPTIVSIDSLKIKTSKVSHLNSIEIKDNSEIINFKTYITSESPLIHSPGQDSFSVPESEVVKDSAFDAEYPEQAESKDMIAKDNNSGNFRYFSKLQGLKHDDVRTLIQDIQGNIWFGTWGGGATRYDGKTFTYYTSKEGLGSDVIKCIIEGKSGKLWFGTWGGGLTSYDGKSFRNYTINKGLKDDKITCILEDKKGNVWIGTTKGGLSKFDGKTFSHYGQKQGLKAVEVHSLCETADGKIWIGTSSGFLSCFDGKQFIHYQFKKSNRPYEIITTFVDKKGDIWMGTSGNDIIRFDGKHFTYYSTKFRDDRINCIFEDGYGNIWFGTYSNGLAKVSGKKITYISSDEGLSHNRVYCILQEEAGNLWFGTGGGGLARYDGHLFRHFTEKEGLSASRIYSILEDSRGDLWFGSWGGGLFKYDGKRFNQLSKKEGLPDDDVNSIMEDRSGNLWIGTWGSGVAKYDGKNLTHFNKKSGLNNDEVTKVIQDRKNNIWIATSGGGVSCFDGKIFKSYTKKQGLSHDAVLSMIEDSKGNMWFGTFGGGVTKYDGKNFVHFSAKDGLQNDLIFTIVEDKKGNIWFGTGGAGLVKYDGAEFTSFSNLNGLSNNYVLSILIEDNSTLWAGTRFGINRSNLMALNEKFNSNASNQNSIAYDQNLFKSYRYSNGFLGIGCNRNAILRSKDAKLWVGANDRLTCIDTDKLFIDSTPPKIQITGIDLYNEKFNWKNALKNQDSSFLLGNGVSIRNFYFDSLTPWYFLPNGLSLAHNNNFLSFRFSGISMHQPEQIRYRYKLDGIDNDWSAISANNYASYGNLPSGNFAFRVKSMNSEGIWSKEQIFVFSIRPPWWKTWWAYSIYGFTSLLSLFAFIKLRERSSRLRQKKLQIKNEELELLNKELDEIIYSMTHDFRSPLLAAIGVADFIQNNPSEYVSSYPMLNTSLNKVDKLLQSIILYYQGKRRKLDISSFSPYLVFNEVLKTLNTERHTNYHINNNIDHNLVLKNDNLLFYLTINQLFRQVLYNLEIYSGNADIITINLSHSSNKEHIIFYIEDNGTPFSNDMLHNNKNIFTEGILKSSDIDMAMIRESIHKLKGRIILENHSPNGRKISLIFEQ